MTTGLPVLAVANHKGGVGKTTISTKLALTWAASGYRVLQIDLDPQGASTVLLRGRALVAGEVGTYEALLGHATLEAVAVEVATGLHLVGAGEMLARAELQLAAEIGREAAFRRALEQIPVGRWDIVVVDCPPSLGILLVNALTAATHVCVPTVPSLLSLAALGAFRDTLILARERLNPGLQHLGYILNEVDAREGVSSEARALISALGEDAILGEVRVDAKARGKRFLSERSRAAGDIAFIADLLAARLGLGEGQGTAQEHTRTAA